VRQKLEVRDEVCVCVCVRERERDSERGFSGLKLRFGCGSCLSVCKNHAMRLMGSSGSPLQSTVYERSMRERERERERDERERGERESESESERKRACVFNVD